MMTKVSIRIPIKSVMMGRNGLSYKSSVTVTESPNNRFSVSLPSFPASSLRGSCDIRSSTSGMNGGAGFSESLDWGGEVVSVVTVVERIISIVSVR